MGFYIRKAFVVGLLRFNLSRSGLGSSFGVKGLRIGSGPRGSYVHMGRGGLYYRKMLKPGIRSHAGDSHSAPMEEIDSVEKIDSGSVQEMRHAAAAEMLAAIRQANARTPLAPWVLGACAVAIICMLVLKLPPVAIVSVAVGSAALLVALFARDAERGVAVINYSMDAAVEREYEVFHQSFDALLASGRVWSISARGQSSDRKYTAGVGKIVWRRQVKPSKGHPPGIRTNIEVPLLPAGAQLLAFMPDTLLVFHGKEVGAVSYQDMELAAADQDFVEDEKLPHDAVVVSSTWAYVNKDGSPDKRFKKNHEIPLCTYTELMLTSPSGLNETFQVSRPGLGSQLFMGMAALRRIGRPDSAGH